MAGLLLYSSLALAFECHCEVDSQGVSCQEGCGLFPAALAPQPPVEYVAPEWLHAGPRAWVPGLVCGSSRPRHTCDIGHPQGLLVLGRLGAVLAALPAPRGAGAAKVDLSGLEEGHHEGLLVLGPVPPDQARQLGVDALP